jgi:hypothetical protein
MRTAAMTNIEALVHRPADHAPGAEIEDRDQIASALAGQDAGGIGHPNVIGSADGAVAAWAAWDRLAGERPRCVVDMPSALARVSGRLSCPGKSPHGRLASCHHPP